MNGIAGGSIQDQMRIHDSRGKGNGMRVGDGCVNDALGLLQKEVQSVFHQRIQRSGTMSNVRRFVQNVLEHIAQIRGFFKCGMNRHETVRLMILVVIVVVVSSGKMRARRHEVRQCFQERGHLLCLVDCRSRRILGGGWNLHVCM